MNFSIVFDFDGTLADTFEIGLDIYNNHLAGRFGLPKNVNTTLDQMELRSSNEVIKQYLTWWNTPIVGFLWEKYSYQYIPSAKLFPGIAELVTTLKQRGFKIGILSSNTHRNVVKCLQNNDLNIFDFIHTNSPLTSKNRALKALFSSHLVDKNNCLYIGDEIKDILSSKQVGIPVISVGWGFNHKQSLINEQPDFFIENVTDLKRLLLDDFSLIEAKLRA